MEDSEKGIQVVGKDSAMGDEGDDLDGCAHTPLDCSVQAMLQAIVVWIEISLEYLSFYDCLPVDRCLSYLIPFRAGAIR